MKKIMAILLCLVLAAGCAVCAAEAADKEVMGTISMGGAFELRCTVPEGYRLENVYSDAGRYIGTLTSEDKSSPIMQISIAFEELIAEVARLNDIDEDGLAKIAATFQEGDEVEITYMETEHGTKLMVVKEIRDSVDYVDIYTIYRGYEIEFVLTTPPGAEVQGLTDAQIQTAVKFLSDLDFVEVE